MKKSSKVLLLSVLAIITAVFGARMYRQRRVDLFFHQFVSLQLDKTSYEDAQKLATQYGAKYSGTQLNTPCTPQDCVVIFRFSNWIFHHVQHDREISLAAGLFIKDGHLTGKEVDFAIVAPASFDYFYSLFDGARLKNDSGYKVDRPRVDAQGMARYVLAELGSNAPDNIRNGAYAIKLQCLTSILGCNSEADVVPEVWR